MLALGVRSHYSLMWGTASPEALCRTAKELGYSGLAMTDTDNLYGLWEYLRACRQHGLKPVVGVELTDAKTPRRALCLVRSNEGFRNLCRLLTARHRDQAFDLQTCLPPRAAGLEMLTTSSELLRAWHKAGLQVMAALPRRISGQTYCLRQAARDLGASMIAVAGSFFLEPGDYLCHRVLRAIALSTSLSRLEPPDLAPPDAWLTPPDEFTERFETLPQTLRAARELDERLEFIPQPRTIMPPWSDPAGRSAAAVLRERSYAGAAWRYGEPLPAAVKERLERELGIIAQKNFSSYFLVVEDIVRSPRICGRGSGAASLVAYALGITNVCPIKFNLYFERFINPQRVDPPDIDMDFAWDERDGVIEGAGAISGPLGHGGHPCAIPGTHGHPRGGQGLRPARPGEIKSIMRRLPWLRGPAEGETGLYPKRQALPKGAKPGLPPPWPEILKPGPTSSRYPAPYVGACGRGGYHPRSHSDYAPLETAAKGVPIIQWEKEGAEQAGLVKIDLLGNRSLAVIRDAIASLRADGNQLDERAWEPEDDPATQDLVAKGAPWAAST
jgi:error-prone DNA polymerase